jgi:type IV pilus assembly protein PilC
MAQFKYTALDRKTGKTITQSIEADNLGMALTRLQTQDLLPLKVSEVEKRQTLSKVLPSLNGRVTPKEIAVFTRQLSATLGGGLLLTEALETIAEDAENHYFKKIIHKVRDDIHAGESFTGALSKHSKVFTKTYCAVAYSGETTGKLHKTMRNLAKFLEDTERTKQKVKNATRYPLFVFGFAMVVVFGLVFFLVPKFKAIFEQFHAKLPYLTRVIIGFSEWTTHNFIGMVLLFIASVVGFIYCLRFYKFRYAVDRFILKIPIIGPDVLYKSLISRFCRTFGFLMEGGVGLALALEIATKAVDHLPMGEAIGQIRDRVIGGASIADELRKQKIFPALVGKMANVGERSGQLADMLQRTADYYDDEMEGTLHDLTALIEPILIVVVGVIVLVVVLSIYLPIFYMSTAIR